MNSQIRCSELKLFDKLNSMICKNTISYKSHRNCSIFNFQLQQNESQQQPDLKSMFIKEQCNLTVKKKEKANNLLRNRLPFYQNNDLSGIQTKEILLHKNLLVVLQDGAGSDGQTVLGFINLNRQYYHMRQIKVDYQMKECLGLQIYYDQPDRHTQNQMFNILFKEEALLWEWKEHLFKYTVATDYHQQFKVTHKIGEGKFSETAGYSSEKDICYLHQEITIHKELSDNSKIVKFYGLFDQKLFVVFIIEYLECGSLLNNIRMMDKLQIKTMIDLVMQFIDILFVMKKKKVLHRDIKLENVGVISNMNNKIKVKILDFGLGTYKFTENQKFRDIQGTPGFIAPEILKKRAYNEKCDIFSFGMAIVVILLGRNPFYGKSRQEVLSKNTHGIVEIKDKQFKKFGKPFKKLLNQMLSSDPKQRKSIYQIIDSQFFRDNIYAYKEDQSKYLRKYLENREMIKQQKRDEFNNQQNKSFQIQLVDDKKNNNNQQNDNMTHKSSQSQLSYKTVKTYNSVNSKVNNAISSNQMKYYVSNNGNISESSNEQIYDKAKSNVNLNLNINRSQSQQNLLQTQKNEEQNSCGNVSGDENSSNIDIERNIDNLKKIIYFQNKPSFDFIK